MLNILKYPFLLLWTIWCALVFVFFNLLGFPFIFLFLLIKNERLYKWAHHIPSLIAQFSLFFWGIRVKKNHLGRFDHSHQYIFIGNHRSMLDALVSGACIPNYKKFIGKAEILRWPFLGYILKRLYIPVKREDETSRKWSREQLLLKMKEGFSMVIFAEGKTNTSSQPLLPFKSGAFSTSCQLQIPLVPFVIYNADNLWHRKTWLIRPGKITLSFLPAIQPLENNEINIQKLQENAHESILSEYLRLRNQH